MLVRKKVEMWDAVPSDEKPGVWILTDCDGKKTEVSDAAFGAVYEKVPDRHESRRRQGIEVDIQETLQNDGEIPRDSEPTENS